MGTCQCGILAAFNDVTGEIWTSWSRPQIESWLNVTGLPMWYLNSPTTGYLFFTMKFVFKTRQCSISWSIEQFIGDDMQNRFQDFWIANQTMKLARSRLKAMLWAFRALEDLM